MTTPASAEPTEGEIEAAVDVVERFDPDERIGPWSDDIAGAVADLLASQRAEIVARYEQVADDLHGSVSAASDEGVRRGYNRAAKYAARRIREAAPK